LGARDDASNCYLSGSPWSSCCCPSPLRSPWMTPRGVTLIDRGRDSGFFGSFSVSIPCSKSASALSMSSVGGRRIDR
ncbi:MAG TPA: hypothetical protein VIH05_07565, partial [Tepidiformaceae bacterium]